MNKVILIGFLGKDAEVKQTQAGKQLVSFNLATTTKWRTQQGEKQERTEWHRCTAWGDHWNGVLPYLHKGQKVCVEGELRYREGKSEDGHRTFYTDIHVEEIELVGKKGDDDARQQKPLGKGKPQAAQQQMDLDDNLPF